MLFRNTNFEKNLKENFEYPGGVDYNIFKRQDFAYAKILRRRIAMLEKGDIMTSTTGCFAQLHWQGVDDCSYTTVDDTNGNV